MCSTNSTRREPSIAFPHQGVDKFFRYKPIGSPGRHPRESVGLFCFEQRLKTDRIQLQWRKNPTKEECE